MDDFSSAPAGARDAKKTSPRYRSGLIAALDIGNSKIACLIARAEPDSLRIIGAALRESRGMRRGEVVDLAEVETAIGECVMAAEVMADERVQNVLISVNCGAPTDISSGAELDVGGVPVTDRHVGPLLAAGRRQCAAEGYDVIHSEPTEYVTDATRGVRNPTGLVCNRLGVVMQGVAVGSLPLANLKQAVLGCHMGVSLSLFSAYASGLAVLTEDEMKLGATVIDIGGGVTSVAVFKDGHLAHVDTVPMGGALVTSDIARVLSTPVADAERVKVLYGAALGERDASAIDEISVPLMGEEGEDGMQRVSRSKLTRIVNDRLEDIFGAVQQRLRAADFDVCAGRRAVLTGGGAQIAGVRELAHQILNKDVRIGRPNAAIGLPAAASGPDYSAVAGLIVAGSSRNFELINPEIPIRSQKKMKKSWLSRLTGYLMG